MKRTTIVWATLTAFLFIAAPASAEVRSVTVTDPADATPPLSGQPNNPDLKQVVASYDSSGSFSFVIDYYNSLNSLSFDPTYGHAGVFSMGDCAGGTAPGISGQHHVASSSTTFDNKFSVAGYTGTLPVTRAVSPDGYRLTITGASSVIANRDYRCFTYYMVGRNRSTASNPNSNYDSSCDCWYTYGTEDDLGKTNYTDTSYYFDGFAPAPPPPEPQPTAPGAKCHRMEHKLNKAKARLFIAKTALSSAIRNDERPAEIHRLRLNVRAIHQKVRGAKANLAEACP